MEGVKLVADFAILLEVLLTGYLLFNMKFFFKMFNVKVIFIFLIILIRYFIDYDNLNTFIAAGIDILYMLFLLYIFLQLYKEKQKIKGEDH